jgi:hypothetical protein
MSATNTAALTAEQPHAFAEVKIMPDFSHRLACDYESDCPDALVRDVEIMLSRSKGMLSLVIDIHDGSRVNEISPENVQWALMSVIRELDDVFALVSTYRDAIANQQA